MHVLRLLSSSNLAGTNSPDGLVGDDNLAPVVNVALEALKLLGNDIDSLASLALLEGLAAAPDDADAVLGSVGGLEGDGLVGLLEDGAALGVAEDGPVDVEVLELLDGDLAGVGAVGLVEDVLGGDLDVVLDALADEGEVEGGRGDDNLNVGVEGGVVQVVDNLLDGRAGPVPVRSRVSMVPPRRVGQLCWRGARSRQRWVMEGYS